MRTKKIISIIAGIILWIALGVALFLSVTCKPCSCPELPDIPEQEEPQR